MVVPDAKKEKPGGKIGSGHSGALLWSGESGSFPYCPGGGYTQEDRSSVNDKGPKGSRHTPGLSLCDACQVCDTGTNET